MGRIIVNISVTLDGVMQAPARPDEDTRGGFKHGGWAVPYSDAVMASAMGEAMARGRSKGEGLLLGRRTYEDLYSVWPSRTDNPYTEVLNTTRKYVVSTTLQEPLPWTNSTLVKGDAVETVSRLKAQSEKDFGIIGSGELIQSLMRHQLIDEFVLLIYPLVLGSGRRLFPDSGSPAQLQLVNTITTTTGVVIATYRTASA